MTPDLTFSHPGRRKGPRSPRWNLPTGEAGNGRFGCPMRFLRIFLWKNVPTCRKTVFVYVCMYMYVYMICVCVFARTGEYMLWGCAFVCVCEFACHFFLHLDLYLYPCLHPYLYLSLFVHVYGWKFHRSILYAFSYIHSVYIQHMRSQ